MLKPEDNERICRVGPGTPMGALMRRYWQPALLSEELPEPDGPPVRVRLLGEDLIAFRDSDGQVGLVDAFCPHRRAPMFFGRNEECGLRCVYHGWKFDRSGACLDMPSEPPDSLFKTKVAITAYPTHEAGGMVLAYLGPPETNPGLPDYELLRATSRHIGKSYQECNWLQALEGGIDSAHFAFLHNNDLADHTRMQFNDHRPEIEAERTSYGTSGRTIHAVDEKRAFVRSNHFVLPAWSIRTLTYGLDGKPAAVPIVSGHTWVPIDDEHCWVYNWIYSYDPAIPVPLAMWTATETVHGRGPDDLVDRYYSKWTRDNEYGLDRNVQKTQSFSGIRGLNLQDVAIQEGMGGLLDRSREHLAQSDRGVILLRQRLFEAMAAVERGEPAPGADAASHRNVRAADILVETDRDWRGALELAEAARF
jgi:nitrite reductase/ring-hydroxylating ferredoxin subunit